MFNELLPPFQVFQLFLLAVYYLVGGEYILAIAVKDVMVTARVAGTGEKIRQD